MRVPLRPAAVALAALGVLVVARPLAHEAQGVATHDWENPRVSSINTERPHATFVPFPSRDEALRLRPDQSPNVLSLNGRWRFQWSPSHQGQSGSLMLSRQTRPSSDGVSARKSAGGG